MNSNSSANPYLGFVEDIVQATIRGRALPLGGFPPLSRAECYPATRPVLIFSPHPDDECIIGGLALRLMRQSSCRVVNVAVTLGSNVARRAERFQELSNACDYLGFELELPAEKGLERITPQARRDDPVHWANAVKTIASTLLEFRPLAILVPHDRDWNGTHIGTHLLVMDALKSLPETFETTVIQTEFWAAMESPNLMVELSVEDVADLVAALSFHVGEVRRNPYHLRLPAWLQDNVRRGAELVGGQGATAPDYTFATLYHAGRWTESALVEAPGALCLGRNDCPAVIAGASAPDGRK